MKTLFRVSSPNESGVTAIEYGLIAGPHRSCHHRCRLACRHKPHQYLQYGCSVALRQVPRHWIAHPKPSRFPLQCPARECRAFFFRGRQRRPGWGQASFFQLRHQRLEQWREPPQLLPVCARDGQQFLFPERSQAQRHPPAVGGIESAGCQSGVDKTIDKPYRTVMPDSRDGRRDRRPSAGRQRP